MRDIRLPSNPAGSLGEFFLYTLPHIRLNNCGMQSFVYLLVVTDFTTIDRIAQNFIKMPAPEQDAALVFTGFGNPLLCAQVKNFDLFLNLADSSVFKVEVVNRSYSLGLLCIYR